jgi:hypothetical protein
VATRGRLSFGEAAAGGASLLEVPLTHRRGGQASRRMLDPGLQCGRRRRVGPGGRGMRARTAWRGRGAPLPVRAWVPSALGCGSDSSVGWVCLFGFLRFPTPFSLLHPPPPPSPFTGLKRDLAPPPLPPPRRRRL